MLKKKLWRLKILYKLCNELVLIINQYFTEHCEFAEDSKVPQICTWQLIDFIRFNLRVILVNIHMYIIYYLYNQFSSSSYTFWSLRPYFQTYSFISMSHCKTGFNLPKYLYKVFQVYWQTLHLSYGRLSIGNSSIVVLSNNFCLPYTCSTNNFLLFAMDINNCCNFIN